MCRPKGGRHADQEVSREDNKTIRRAICARTFNRGPLACVEPEKVRLLTAPL